MRCPHCGEALPDAGAVTCPTCGVRLDEVQHLTASEPDSSAQSGETVLPSSPAGAASPPVSLPGAAQAEAVPASPAPGNTPSITGDQLNTTQPNAPAPYAPYAPYPSAAASSPRQSRRGGRIALIVTLTVVAVLLICGGSGIALFSYAQSHRLLGAAPAAVGTPTPTPTSFVIYQNSLATKATGWADDSHCSFEADGYHIHDNYVCFAPIGPLASVDVSADEELVGGSDNQAYGLSFRYERPDAATGYGDHYTFGIDMKGHWSVWKVVGGQIVRLADFAPSAAIKTSPGTTNHLRARAVDEQFDFFINDTFVGHVDDSRFTGGYVGTTGYVGVAGCISCDVLVSNVVVSEVSQL